MINIQSDALQNEAKKQTKKKRIHSATSLRFSSAVTSSVIDAWTDGWIFWFHTSSHPQVSPICISGMNFWLQDTEQQQNQSMVSNT